MGQMRMGETGEPATGICGFFRAEPAGSGRVLRAFCGDVQASRVPGDGGPDDQLLLHPNVRGRLQPWRDEESEDVRAHASGEVSNSRERPAGDGPIAEEEYGRHAAAIVVKRRGEVEEIGKESKNRRLNE